VSSASRTLVARGRPGCPVSSRHRASHQGGPEHHGAPVIADVRRPVARGGIVAGETPVTMVGNLTADPELRHAASGIPVAGFTIASYNRDRGEWADGEPLFLRCPLWRQAAENAAHSLTRGMRVIVTGRLRQRTFDDKEGQRRTCSSFMAGRSHTVDAPTVSCAPTARAHLGSCGTPNADCPQPTAARAP
jgi:single-strand DNA-binding protein